MVIGSHISIINLNVNGLMLQPKATDWLNGYRNKTPIFALHKRPTSDLGTHTDWKWGLRKILHANGNQNKVRVALHMEKAMAPHSSTLAWEIPWTEEPGGLQSMGSLRVGHDWVTSLSLFTFMHWRRKWQPTPVFLPGESQGQGSLVGCCLWGCTESDMTEVT